MPFLRVARDARGYETTILLHTAHPGETPRVLYWYRSAPGVRVGRPALDEDAIRTIEEQHPEIEFDWPHILELGTAMIEVENRPERRGRFRGDEDRGRRRGRARPEEAEPAAAPAADAPLASPAAPGSEGRVLDAQTLDEQPIATAADEAPLDPPRAPDLLAELVGRDIATRLRARYAEINARIHQAPADEATRASWQARAAPLDPDSWLTPDEILRGVTRADELFDALRRDLLG